MSKSLTSIFRAAHGGHVPPEAVIANDALTLMRQIESELDSLLFELMEIRARHRTDEGLGVLIEVEDVKAIGRQVLNAIDSAIGWAHAPDDIISTDAYRRAYDALKTTVK